MRNYLFLFLLLGFLQTHAKSFIKIYNEESLAYGRTVSECPDGSLIFCAHNGNVWKTDGFGKVIWQKKFLQESIVSVSPSGTIYLISPGTDLQIIKLSANGNQISSTTIFQNFYTNDYPVCVQFATNGDLVVGGYSRFGSIDTSPIVFRTDSNANLIWSKMVYQNSPSMLKGIALLHDGGIAVAGNFSKQGLMMRLNSTGNTIWTQLVQMSYINNANGFNGVTELADSTLLFAGSISPNYWNPQYFTYLVKKSFSGGTIAVDTLNSEIYWLQSMISSVIKTTNGFLLLTNSSSNGMMFYRFSTNMNLIDSVSPLSWLIPSGYIDPYTFIKTMDNGFVITASSNLFYGNDIPNGPHLILIRTDSLGKCSDIGSVQITANGPTEFCGNDSVILSVRPIFKRYAWAPNSFVHNTDTLHVKNNGLYFCIMEDWNKNIIISDSIRVNVHPFPSPNIYYSWLRSFCHEDTSTTISTDYSSEFSYQWYLNGNSLSGLQNNSFKPVQSGNYTVTVFSNCGVSTSAPFFLNGDSVPVPSIISSDQFLRVAPFTNCTPSLTLKMLSAEKYLSFQWNKNGIPISGATDSSYQVNSPGNYSVSVTNGCGITTSSGFYIGTDTLFADSINVRGVLSGCSSSLTTLSTQSGIPALSWYLNGVEISNSRQISYQPVASGNYTYSYTYYCSDGITAFAISKPITYTYNPNPRPNLILPNGNTNCSSGVMITAPVSQSGYIWYFNDNLLNGITTQTINATSPGNYFCIITTPTCGTIASDTVYVTGGTPTIQINKTNAVLCSGGTVELSVSSDPLFTYQWRRNGTNISSATQSFFSAAQDGTYDCIVTNSCGSRNSPSCLITASTINTSFSSSSDFLCNDSVVMTVASGYTYQWYKNTSVLLAGATQSTYITYTFGNYSVVISDSVCSIRVPTNGNYIYEGSYSKPLIWSETDPNSCGSSVLLHSPYPGSIWYKNNTPLNYVGFDYTATSSGVYKIYTQFYSACDNYSNEITVDLNGISLDIYSDTSPLFCTGDSITLKSSVTGTTYSWSFNSVPISTASQINVSQEGLYKLTETNAQGCTGTGYYSVYNNPGPSLQVKNESVTCSGNDGVLSINAQIGSPFLYNWSTGDTAQKIRNLIPGNYQVTVTNRYGCTATSANTITQSLNLPSIDLYLNPNFTYNCQFTMAYLSVSPYISNYTYDFYYNNSNINNYKLNDSTVFNGYGLYRCIATNSCGSTADTLFVTQLNYPPTQTNITILGPDSVCANATSVRYIALPVSNATGFIWNVPPGAQLLSGQGTDTILVSFQNAVSGIVQAVPYNECGSAFTYSVHGKQVIVKQLPLTPSTIIGDTLSCNSATTIYSVTPNSNAQWYSWTCSSGTQLSPGTTSSTVQATFLNQLYQQSVCVQANNSCGVSESTCKYISMNYGLVINPISGTSTICNGSVNTFSISPLTGASSYSWTSSAGLNITSGTTSNQISTLATNSGFTNVCVQVVNASNSCTSSLCKTLVVYDTQAPTSISGLTSVCPSSSGLLYCVPNSLPNETYNWSVPNGTFTGQGNDSIMVAYSNSVYGGLITVTKSNQCGVSPSRSLFVNGIALPTAATSMNGPTQLCLNSPSIAYSISPIPGATSYSWTYPQGCSINGNGSGNSITISTNNSVSAGNICVSAVNQCGSGNSYCKAVTPLTSGIVGSIQGYATACANTNATYSVQPVSNATNYTWTVPAGASISFGQGTNSILVIFSTAPTGSICVSMTNSCGTVSSSCLNISAPTSLATPVLFGSTIFCSNSTQSYSCQSISSANTYQWTVSGGLSIASGQGTNAISVSSSSGFSSGTISVRASNCAYNSPISQINVIGNPTLPSSIIGPTTINSNQSGVTYSIPPVANATSYVWTVPSTATIISGQGTTSILVNFQLRGGRVAVKALNGCGYSPTRVMTVVALPSFNNSFQGLTIFPNPSTGHFNCSWEKANVQLLRITDMNGKIVHEEKIPISDNYIFNKEVDPGILENGMYLIFLQTSTETIVEKLVIVK